SLPGLLAGNRVPCVGQFTVGEPLLRMQAAPAKLVRFAFADAGVSFYGNGLIATDNTIATKADIVRRFVAGTIRGMKDAFARPDEAGRIMNKYHPAIDVAVAEGETKAVAELAQVKGRELGVIDPARIEETINVVNSVFKLKAPVAVNDVYAPGFVSKGRRSLRRCDTPGGLVSVARVAVPDFVSNSYFPGIAAIELGFFAREGLDVVHELIFPNYKAYEALRDGKIDFVAGPAHAVFRAFPEWEGAKL